MDLDDIEGCSSNFVYKLIELPSPPQIPPTKLNGVSVEDRVEAYECRRNLLGVINKMGMGMGSSPIHTKEYPIHPSPRRSMTTRVWRTSPTMSNKIESDYETMLPQFSKLHLTPTRTVSFDYEDHQISDSPSCEDVSSCSSHHYQRHSPYVVFRDKSTLFMASPTSTPHSPTSTNSTTEAIYARIDYDDSFENDRSTDSGFSDRQEEMYERLEGASLTSDDISLLTRYEGVLKNRSKKSRFKKLSDLLCSGGSTSDDEDDSLYDSLDSETDSSSSPGDTDSHVTSSQHMTSASSDNTDNLDSTIRFSKKHFFYAPSQKIDPYLLSAKSSEYVMAETLINTPSSTKHTPVKPSRHQFREYSPKSKCKNACYVNAKSVSSPRKTLISHDYENIRDFTKPRKGRT